MNIWNHHEIEDGKIYKSQIGPLMFWFEKISDELHIFVERLQNSDTEIETVSFSVTDEQNTDELSWSRWIIVDNCNSISLFPVMPDRPVVVRPEVPVKIPKGRKALFFVSIPIWISVGINKPEEVILCEEPSIILSNIWFGDPMSGELCYSLRSRARRQIFDTEPKPHRAICPVRILNTTNSQLDIERFCVHVEHLNIYKGTTRLWTNEVKIRFQGEDSVSKIDYGQKPPEFEEAEDIIKKARTPWKKTLLKKSLGTFKSLTGF